MQVSVLCLVDSLDQVCGSGTGALLMCTRYAVSPSTKRIAYPMTLAATLGHTFRVADTSLRNVGYATHFRTIHHRHNRSPLESSPCWKCVVCVTFKGRWHGSDGQQSVSQRRGQESVPGQAVYDVWCTKWHCFWFLSKYFGFFPCHYHFTWTSCSLLCHRRCMILADVSLAKSTLKNQISKNFPFVIGIV